MSGLYISLPEAHTDLKSSFLRTVCYNIDLKYFTLFTAVILSLTFASSVGVLDLLNFIFILATVILKAPTHLPIQSDPISNLGKEIAIHTCLLYTSRCV